MAANWVAPHDIATESPVVGQDAADSDDNGQLNITDGVRILNYLFLGGPDPTADDLPPCVYEVSC